ncbi:phosphoesterase [Mycoplasma phocoeninasale]|uniref:Phosphoesterase n=1 Tax=Mycoplasma phocoeninasale TaxID=2726117 RepID=A0A858U2M1_9MOLU|nr:DHHA1 domain-containing protein [Mycoplasma phocoeninasale]QJG66201.1 phosphoesterase [Mycoplasma phocoeninasale]
MKTQFEQFWDYVQKSKYITLCTHIEPDGDTLGSAIALRELIKLNCSDVEEVRISGGDYPRNLQFIIDEPISLVSDEYFNKSLKIVVDTSTKSRIFDQRIVTEESLKLDHHPHENKWLFEIGGDNWPATGQLIVNLVKALNLKTNEKCLEGLAMSIVTDTEYFKERNISDETFYNMGFLLEKGLDYNKLLMSMHANEEENSQIIKAIQNIKEKGNTTYTILKESIKNDVVRPLVAKVTDLSNTEVTIVFMKKEDGNIRCSIRSKSYINVSKIAKHFGGGGHFSSSGFIIDTFDKVDEVIDYINQQND